MLYNEFLQNIAINIDRRAAMGDVSAKRTTITVCTFILILIAVVGLAMLFTKRAPAAVRQGRVVTMFLPRAQRGMAERVGRDGGGEEREREREYVGEKKRLSVSVVESFPLLSYASFMKMLELKVSLGRDKGTRLERERKETVNVEEDLKAAAFATCSICVEDFKDTNQVRILPCDHLFHSRCVDPWLLKSSQTCPVCRAELPEILARLSVDVDVNVKRPEKIHCAPSSDQDPGNLV